MTETSKLFIVQKDFMVKLFIERFKCCCGGIELPARLDLCFSFLMIFIFIVTAMAQESFKCPDDYGFYPHHTSCDKYWKCDNGAAELKTCGNGLAFEATDSKYLSENCDYHHNVECGDRTQFGKYEVTVFLFSPWYKYVLCIHNIPSTLFRSLGLSFFRFLLLFNNGKWCGCWKGVSWHFTETHIMHSDIKHYRNNKPSFFPTHFTSHSFSCCCFRL